MRLEIDAAVSAPPRTEVDSQGNVDSAEAKSALNQGVKAAQAGNRAQARTSLLRATELDPRNENAWLWLASISEYPEELLGFLNHVLDINPENQRANEWKTATHALLSKTFVQRGIDASQENQKDFATECFQTALEYDDCNAVAWMWMASLSDSNTVKISLLEKALELDPENESALAAIEAARASILKERLTEAKTAAVAGNHAEANGILDSLLAVNPNSIEAWTMKSHLAEGFDEKIRCFENILAIDPDNVAAKAGRDSLLAIFGTAEAANTVQTDPLIEPEDDPVTELSPEPSLDKSPTQDLEMPAGFSYEAEPATEITPEENYDHEEPEAVAEPFATFAEETPQSFEAPSYDEEQAVNAELNAFQPEPAPESYEEEPVHAEAIGFQPEPLEDTPETEALYADPQAETVAFSYDQVSDLPASDEFEGPEVDWSNVTSDPAIVMPADSLPVEEAPARTGAETFVEPAEVLTVKAETFECPFCHDTNDGQVISCRTCMAVLTLSDLELLLANQSSDKLTLRRAVEDMERRRMNQEFDSDDLVILGLGHLNLRNLQMGYACLQEASKLNPNNVVLSSQVNSLLIRLEEIKQQEEAQLKMPKGKSILVVDDSPTVRKLIAGKLEKCGHDVVCANDGVEAIERLENFVPDLILLDITMPRMDGYQVCKQIRSNSATKDVTVVMISGKDGFFDKVRGRMAGTTGYITKPFGPETLMKAVEMYLSGEAPELEDDVEA